VELSDFLLSDVFQSKALKLINYLVTILGGFVATMPMFFQIKNSNDVNRIVFLIQKTWILSLPENKGKPPPGFGGSKDKFWWKAVVCLRFFGPFVLCYLFLLYLGFIGWDGSSNIQISSNQLLLFYSMISLPAVFIINSFPAWFLILGLKIRNDPEKKLAILGFVAFLVSSILGLFI
jgi:hypothetical protein